MTDHVAPTRPGSADQLERVEALRRRRADARPATTVPARRSAPPGLEDQSAPSAPKPPSGRGRRSRRAHPASGSRIGVAGGGLAAMLGLVAAFGLVEKSAGAGPVAPTPGQVVVVIHRNGEAPAAGAGSTAVVAPASGPIALTARPIVNAATPVPQTPAATTNGSR